MGLDVCQLWHFPASLRPEGGGVDRCPGSSQSLHLFAPLRLCLTQLLDSVAGRLVLVEMGVGGVSGAVRGQMLVTMWLGSYRTAHLGTSPLSLCVSLSLGLRLSVSLPLTIPFSVSLTLCHETHRDESPRTALLT